MYSNVFSSEIRQQNRTEQNRTEQNPYRASFGRRTERASLSKSSKADCRTITKLISIMEQNYYKAYFIAKENLAKFISVV